MSININVNIDINICYYVSIYDILAHVAMTKAKTTTKPNLDLALFCGMAKGDKISGF